MFDGSRKKRVDGRFVANIRFDAQRVSYWEQRRCIQERLTSPVAVWRS